MKGKQSTSKTEGVKIVCKVCGNEKTLTTNFYKSSRPEYSEIGFCNVCKSCFKELLINPETGMIDKHRFKSDVCRMLDIPFIPYEYTALVQKDGITTNNFLGEYRKILNVKRDYKNLHYEDSARFENDQNGLLANSEKEYEQVTPEMIEFWGRGFPPEYYIDVQKRYDNFMEFEDLDKLDYKKQSDYKTLCQLEHKKTEMFQDKETKATDIRSITDAISKLSEDLNIKALQKKNDESNTGHYIIGLVTKYIEDVKLTPIPKLEDIDWLGDMPKSEFDIEMSYFKSEMLNELNRPNPYQEIVDNDKKKYSPTEEELDINRLNEDEEDEQ